MRRPLTVWARDERFGRGVAMVEFSTREEIEHWLGRIQPAQRQRAIGAALAVRAALRVVPLLNAEFDLHTDVRDVVLTEIILPVFRATLIAWTAARYPAHQEKFQAAAAANIGPRDPTTEAATPASDYTLESIFAALRVMEVPISNCVTTVGYAVDRAIHAGAEAAAREGEGPPGAGAVSCDEDAEAIDSGLSAVEVAGNPLWPTGAPRWAAGAWQELKAILLSSPDDWEVWTDWYEARLAGDTGYRSNEQLEVARATIPDAIWRLGPSDVNAEIKRLSEEHDWAKKLPYRPGRFIPQIRSAEGLSIPEQDRTGTRFVMDAGGRIDVLQIPPVPDDLQRFHYGEMRRKAEALAELGQMLGAIALAVKGILEALPECIEDASVDRLWSRGNTLRRRHDAHVRTVDNNLGPDPARMHPLVAATLGDFIDSFNVYVIGDPRGLELDRVRLGPQDREAARKIATLAAPIARAVTEAKSLATPAAQEALSEQVDAAIDAPDDINGDQAAELARKTAGNFVGELLRQAYAPIQKLGRVVMAETKVALKEYRAGIYRGAGTATFAGGAYLCWPEISSFIVHNADALRAFAIAAYQNPMLVEIINLIVRAASDG
jgi:hypothetical protein